MTGMSDSTFKRHFDELGVEPERVALQQISRPFYSLGQVLRVARLRARRQYAFARPLTVSVWAPKGGVGKSTVSRELIADLSLMGYNVLGVDNDDQASLTLMMGYEPDDVPQPGQANEWLVAHTFLHAMYGVAPGCSPVDLEQVWRHPFGPWGPKLIPADITMGELAYRMSALPGRELEIRRWLHEQVHGRRPAIDVVVIDNAPSTSVVSRAAVVAADILLVPVRLDMLSIKSIHYLATELAKLAKGNLPVPRVVACPNYFKVNTSRTARVMQTLRDDFGGDVPISPHISYTDKIGDAILDPRGSVDAPCEEVLPIAFQHRNRHYERLQQEIRALTQFVLDESCALGLAQPAPSRKQQAAHIAAELAALGGEPAGGEPAREAPDSPQAGGACTAQVALDGQDMRA